nr:unnamed protein product [Callosobruchus chinensis]
MTDSPRPVHPEGDSADQLANYLANLDLETRETETRETETTSNLLVRNMTTPSVSRHHVPSFDVKLLQIIPDFDGNPCRLYRYLEVSTDLLNTYWNATEPDCVQNKILLHGIFSKLSGAAEQVFSLSGTSDWDTIKNLLISHFGDQRNESSLISDMTALRQNSNESSLQFYSRVVAMLNHLHNFVSIHETNDAIKASKKTLFDSHALHTLLVGLKEPKSSMIRSMKPNNLAEAQKYILEDNNIRYLQKSSYSGLPSNKSLPPPVPPKPHFQIQPNSFFRQPMQSTPQFRPQPHFNQQFPRGPINITPRQYHPPQRFPTNAQVFGPKPNVNVWRQPPPHRIPFKPTPMSIQTHLGRNTTDAQSNRFKPSGPRNFAFEELHNVESDNMYSQNFEYYPYDNSYTEYYPSTENQLDNENYYYSSEPSVSVDSNQNHEEENFQVATPIVEET